jgi:hypothetical protein
MPGIGIGSQTIFRGESSQIEEQSAIAPVNASAIDTTYGTEEADVITDLRTKLNDLIDKLEAVGILAA